MPRNRKHLGELPARSDEALHQAASPNIGKVTVLEVQQDEVEQAGAGPIRHGNPSADLIHGSHNHQYRALMDSFRRLFSGHEHRVEKLLSKFEQRLTQVITNGFAKSSKIPRGPEGMQPHVGPYGMPPHMSSRLSSPLHKPLEKTPSEETQVYDVQSEPVYLAPVQLPNALTDVLSHDNESKAKAPQESEASGNETEERPSSRNKKAWEPSETHEDQLMSAPNGAESHVIGSQRERGVGAARQTVFTNKVGLANHVQKINQVQEELKKGRGFLKTATEEEDKTTRQATLQELESLGYCGRADLCMRNCIVSNAFEMISCVFIVLNVFFLGAQLEFELLNPGRELALGYRVLNTVFVVIFTLELLLRIYAEKIDFCKPRNLNFGWNMFDSLLVLLSIMEEILSNTSSGVNLGAMRVFRTLRIVRSFRIIRMFKVFKDLRIMLAGVVYSLRSLVWAGLLLSAIMYLTAVCLGQYASEEIAIKTLDPSEGVLSKEVYDALQKYYGSLFLIVYTLFTSICGGVDWADAADPMMKLGTPLGLVFIFYISFAILCVLNIITGVFVENANRLTAKDDEMVLLENMEKRKVWFEEVAELFRAADKDGSGRLDGKEFAVKMKDYRMQAWLQKIGVQVESYSAEGLFALLDFDGDGWLDLDEFAVALQSVHGPARSIDLAKVNKDTRQLRKDMKELNFMCSQMVELLGYAQASER